MDKKIILASTSKYRQELLSRLGVEFESIDPGVDEDQIKDLVESPVELAETLAREKARVVYRKNPNACIIAGDQLAHIDGEILGKPGNFDAAVEQLLKLQGKEHVLVTSICVIDDDVERIFTDRTFLKMRDLSKAELTRYVDQDRPLSCAGSYMLEKQGISLFERIKGDDHTAIMGIPLMGLSKVLNECGISIP